MLSRSLMTVLGLAVVGLIGGCCTCDKCGTSNTTSEVVHPEATYIQSAPADCGCGCSAASSSSYVPTSYSTSYPTPAGSGSTQFTEAGSGSTQVTEAGSGSTNVTSESGSGSSSRFVGDAATSVDSPVVVEPPSNSSVPGFTAGSSTRGVNNLLPGNLLPSEN